MCWNTGPGALQLNRHPTRLRWRPFQHRAALYPAIAANPFITFFTIATESGKFDFEWIGDNGFSEKASATISVE